MKRIFSFLIVKRPITLVLALLITFTIFIACSLPGNEIPKMNLLAHFDKLIHFLFFLFFFIIWKLYYYKYILYEYIILIISFVYGVGLEFYQQYLVIGRSFDSLDIAADAIGALSGMLFLKIYKMKIN